MTIEGLGPLPKSDRADQLEELSVQSLSRALPIDRFRVRTEPGKDRGCDRYIEAKVGGCDTNCRSQVQLKGTDSTEANSDGSMSRDVDVANLNYLGYGPCPLYILYVATSNELRFVWAREEIQRLDRDNPNWRRQTTVSLRFSRRLEPAIDEIHARILQEARFERDVHEVLARSTVTDRVQIQIDPANLTVSDPNAIRELLLESGMAIVASGYARRAADLFEALNPADKAMARLQLVNAYAQYLLDDYFAAQSSLSEAARNLDALSENDRQWHTRLRRICDYRLGRIDRAAYLRLEEEAGQRLTGLPALEHRLEAGRHRLLMERDLQRRHEIKQEIEAIVEGIRIHPDAPDGLRIAARICELYAEGQQCVVESTHLVHVEAMRAQLGAPMIQETARQARDAAASRWRIWSQRIYDTYNEAVAARHPLLIADALYTSGAIRHTACMQEEVLHEVAGLTQEGREERIRTALGFLDDAYAIYSQMGCAEDSLRAAMLRADLHDLLGETDSARHLAEAVLPQATAMQYTIIEQSARDRVEGRTMLQQLRDRLARVRAADEDQKLAALSDSELVQLARDTVAAAGLPEARTEAVRRHHESRRAIARERLAWCRHIDLDSDFSGVISKDDLLANDPEQVCLCRILGYRSTIASADWQAVLQSFKDNHCVGCASREPKQ